jgi:hypothetical protein
MKSFAGRLLALLSLATLALPTLAAPFEVAISPSRFELAAKPGTRLGQSLTIYNVGAGPTDVAIRTLDWSYSADGNVSYHDELMPRSCRPWVTLERRTVRVPAQGKFAFRFQVEVPPDVARTECRFMLAVEGIEPAYQAQIQSGAASLSLPVSGRIAVAVYVMVGGAEPRLVVEQLGVRQIKGRATPVITINNAGDAHGRLEGGLEAQDAKGQKFVLVPEGTPIMPGQTRTLPLMPRAEEGRPPVEVTLPIRSQGQLDWELGSFKIDYEFR